MDALSKFRRGVVWRPPQYHTRVEDNQRIPDSCEFHVDYLP